MTQVGANPVNAPCVICLSHHLPSQLGYLGHLGLLEQVGNVDRVATK